MAAVLALLVLLLGGGAAGWFLYAKPIAQRLQADVVRDLGGGAAQLQAGTDDVHKANQDHNVALLDDASAHFTDATASFRSAESRVLGNTYLNKAASIPYLGNKYLRPEVDTVVAVSEMGVSLAGAGQDTVDVDRLLLAPGDPNLTAGQRLIAILKKAGPPLGALKNELNAASADAAKVDPTLLPLSQRATFTKTRAQIDSGLAGIVEFERLTPVLVEVLGGNGTRTYLVEQVDPAELRGGGGFIGSFSILQADSGNLKLVRSADVATVDHPYPQPGDKKYLAPPQASLQFTAHGWVFGDSNFYSDFPTTAQSGERLFLNQTGTKVDGVISLDPWAVASLLAVTGPIAIPEYHTTANSATFAEDVFQRTENANAGNGRKDYFGVVANRLLETISGLQSGSWPSLLNTLNSAVQQRHLQVYFNNADAEKEMGNIFWASSMIQPTATDETLLEVESNFAASKANHFLQRSFDLTLTVDAGKLHHHLVVTLVNSTPDGYIGGRTYGGYMRLYYPATATGMSIHGLAGDRFPSDEQLSGLQLADGWFYLPINELKPGAQTSGQYTFDWATDIRDLAQGHSIYWQKQAGTLADKVHVTLKMGDKTFSADTDLGQDRRLVVGQHGVVIQPGNQPNAHLPVLGS